MACLPLIERELRVALRKQRPRRGRLKAAALATGGSMLFLLYGALTGDSGVGRRLEQALCLAGLYFVLRAPRLTAGVLAEERRNQTLGLLFLSGLGAGEVFAGKFFSSALVAFTNLLAIFPMLALPFLLGGVSFDLFLATICALPVLMLFALSVSLLASTLTRDDGAAVVLANVLGALICALTPAIYFAQIHFAPLFKPSPRWLELSPAFGPYLIWERGPSGFGPLEQADFWPNILLTLGWSVMALFIAAFALKRLWRKREVEEAAVGWRGRWRKFVHGSRESRQRLARAWLVENPFVWLAGRDRQPATLGWTVVAGIVLAWLFGWALWPAPWLSVANLFITGSLLNSALMWLIRHTAAQQLCQARRDGAYELLLTTRLNPHDIVYGTLQALRRHFRPILNCVLALNVLMMLGGLLTRPWNGGALCVHFFLWLVMLVWTWSIGHQWWRALPAMWAGLNCCRPAYAVWRASFGSDSKWFIWILVWNFYCFLQFGGIQRFPRGSAAEVWFTFLLLTWVLWVGGGFVGNRGRVHDFMWDPQAKVWLRVTVPKNARIDRVCETRLIAEFREIAREPVPDPSDPRFRKWNARERFPWGWDLVQEQLHERLVRKLTEAPRT